MSSEEIITLIYLISAIFFILGLKGLAHPKTAVKGNLISAIGMLIAIIATLFWKEIISYEYIILGLIIGSVVGSTMAMKVSMTAMPQIVGVLNGFGGLASFLVAGGVLINAINQSLSMDYLFLISVAIAGIIGAPTFSGSMIAAGKLQGIVNPRPLVFKGHNIVKSIILVLAIIPGIMLVFNPSSINLYWILIGLSLIFGVLLTIPIGGADMPIIICLLNSLSGLAACATGFVLNNILLIVAGSLVGASGIVLTNLMSKAMNRSLRNVLFAGFGAKVEKEEDIYAGRIKSTSPEEVAMLLDASKRVVIIPGYGMAVAQAQYAVKDLMDNLIARGVEVEFGIHPVAGRMPGHMNVLLAEAGIPYDRLKAMGEINSTMPQTDVAIILGANDVVNPDARDKPSTPISGMPIIEADKAKAVVVIKRSLSPGFSGLPNPLFIKDNTLMLFGDGKKMVIEINSALKEK